MTPEMTDAINRLRCAAELIGIGLLMAAFVIAVLYLLAYLLGGT